MKKYMYVENGTVLEVLETESDISELFHPSMKWVPCTQSNVNVGFVFQAGEWVAPSTVDTKYLSVQERAWRDKEIVRADYELNKVQDGDYKAVGSVGDWRSYRKALRAWPDSDNFPNKNFRPKAPDSEAVE